MNVNSRQFAAALGFAFVVTAIALNIGWAVLALVGALVFYLAVLLVERGIAGDWIEGVGTRLADTSRENRARPGERSRVK